MFVAIQDDKDFKLSGITYTDIRSVFKILFCCLFTFLTSPFRYDAIQSLWKATNKENKDFLATSEAKESSLLIGPQNWTIYNDSKYYAPSTKFQDSKTSILVIKVS